MILIIDPDNGYISGNKRSHVAACLDQLKRKEVIGSHDPNRLWEFMDPTRDQLLIVIRRAFLDAPPRDFENADMAPELLME